MIQNVFQKSILIYLKAWRWGIERISPCVQRA